MSINLLIVLVILLAVTLAIVAIVGGIDAHRLAAQAQPSRRWRIGGGR